MAQPKDTEVRPTAPEPEPEPEPELEPEPTSPTPETTEATEKQAADVFAEFLKTGRVREGYAVNVMWPEKARRLKKD